VNKSTDEETEPAEMMPIWFSTPKHTLRHMSPHYVWIQSNSGEGAQVDIEEFDEMLAKYLGSVL